MDEKPSALALSSITRAPELHSRLLEKQFTKVEVPVVGIVENMSYFLCPHCGGRSEIFSHGGARQEAERLGTEFLGEVPLDLKIREAPHGGTPITVSDPDNPYSLVFRQ